MYTYFRVIGKDKKILEEFKKLFNSDYEIKEAINGDISLSLFKCNDESLDLNLLLRKTIRGLKDNIDLLNEYRNKYGLEYYLVRVVELNDNNKPILSLDADIIEFLFKVSAKDDLDYYL